MSNEESPESGGGTGELQTTLMSNLENVRKDAMLIENAVEKGYPIDEQLREFMVRQAVLVAGKSRSERNRLAAVRILAALDKLNADREGNEKPVEHIHEHRVTVEQRRDRISDIASRFGIDVVDGSVASGGAGQSGSGDARLENGNRDA